LEGKGGWISVSVRSSWSTEQVPDTQPYINQSCRIRTPVSKKEGKKREREKEKEKKKAD
jgi:hypothetical protein